MSLRLGPPLTPRLKFPGERMLAKDRKFHERPKKIQRRSDVGWRANRRTYNRSLLPDRAGRSKSSDLLQAIAPFSKKRPVAEGLAADDAGEGHPTRRARDGMAAGRGTHRRGAQVFQARLLPRRDQRADRGGQAPAL